ncbi:MAG: hypothetical protein H2174_07705 [Vampirovibrio sp.]|nr:hypothetical protein [Vampirovibrio sp.]
MMMMLAQAAMPPEKAAQQFFQLFMSNQFAPSFECFSKKSQNHFLEWSFNHLKAQHPKAIEASELSTKEVHIMFKRNDPSLIQSFWKHFYFNSGAGEIYQFGYFEPDTITGNEATVAVRLEYPNGQKGSTKLTMVKEGGQWKFGYLESGLDF